MDHNQLSLEQKLEQVEKQLEAIYERNYRVELDKAWELSRLRVAAVAVLTYILTALVFFAVGIKHALLSAFIPTLGYYLSVQSLPILKRYWIQNYGKRN